MGEEFYRQVAGTVLRRGERGVVIDTEGHAHFYCPCGERRCFIRSDIHGIVIHYNDVGALRDNLTVEGSILSRGSYFRDGETVPIGVCHFHIRAGVPTMCGDSTCPGSRETPP